MALEIPRPLRVEHDELHAKLARATKLPGKTGEAARAVAQVLHPRFAREEEIALPALGLLKALAQDRVTPDMEHFVALTDKLKAALPEMLEEHKSIVRALGTLVAAANTEKQQEAVALAEALTLHAQTEEDVLYPAAIVVGAYVREVLDRGN